MEIIERLPLIDIAVLILCLRIGYMAVSRGVLKELLHLAALLVGAVCAVHYYSLLSSKVVHYFSALNQKAVESLSFLVIFFAVSMTVSLLRKVISSFLKKEELSSSEKAVSLGLGFLRCVILVSVLFFVLDISPLDHKYYDRTISYKVCAGVAGRAYAVTLQAYQAVRSDSIVAKKARRSHETTDTLSGSR